MTEWKEGIWLALSILVAVAVLFAATLLLQAAKIASSKHQEEQNAIEVLAEYRKWNSYDNTTVTYDTMMSLQYREAETSYFKIRIYSPSTFHIEINRIAGSGLPNAANPTAAQGHSWTSSDTGVWSADTWEDRLTTGALFPNGLATRFKSYIVYDAGGTVIGVDFVRET